MPRVPHLCMRLRVTPPLRQALESLRGIRTRGQEVWVGARARRRLPPSQRRATHTKKTVKEVRRIQVVKYLPLTSRSLAVSGRGQQRPDQTQVHGPNQHDLAGIQKARV